MLRIEAGDHIGARVANGEMFAMNTITFARQGASAGAKVVVFPQAAERDLTAAAIRSHTSGLANALTEGFIEIADSAAAQMAPGRFDPQHLQQLYSAATADALHAGFTGLWVSVDMAWASPSTVDPAHLQAFEAAAYPLFSSHEFTALCQYDTRVFPAGQACAACQAHPVSPSGVALRHNNSGDGLRTSGEADLTNGTAWATLLASLGPGRGLDITGMSFLDVAAYTAIARVCAEAAGLTITATASQAQVLDLLGDTSRYVRVLRL